jgi:ribonuclease HI
MPIVHAVVTPHHGIANLPAFTFQTRVFHDVPERVIYADGGTYVRSGVSAAAITVHDGVNPTPNEEHSLYVADSTNNICEYIAFIAALRYVASRPARHTLIIVDSKLVITQVTGQAKCRNPHLKPLLQQAQAAYAAVSPTTTLAHMLRDLGNKADQLVTRTKNQAGGVGDQSLFVTPPSNVKRPRAAPPSVTYPNTSMFQVASHVRTSEDFINIRHFSTRSRCPTGAVDMWSNLVKQTLQQAEMATSLEERSEAVLTLILMPTVFLPLAAPRSRVEGHLRMGRPFDLASPRQSQEDAADRPTASTQATRPDDSMRVARTVTRLAYDRKLRSAVKILQQESRERDSSFEEKQEALKAKFIARSAEVLPLDSTTTNQFPSSVILKVLRKMSRNAANCIDGWNRDLAFQAISAEPSIADALGCMCAWINNGQLSDKLMQILRMGRLVAVPKPDGGIRPIVISSFFLKLTGACVLEMAKRGGANRASHTTKLRRRPSDPTH